MAQKTKKSEITHLAKRICKINEQLMNMFLSAEDLVQDETLRNIFFEKDEAVLRELHEKVLKYSELEEPTDVIAYEYYLEEVHKILFSVFYNE